MRLRPYIEAKDFEYLSEWTKEERVHALWSAGHFSYPLSRENLRNGLDKIARKDAACPYTVTDSDGHPVGFFVYSTDCTDNSGFLRHIVLDGSIRGKGYGRQLIQLALQFAFQCACVSSVSLNVFTVNLAARKCYAKAGFVEECRVENAHSFQDETWSKCRMTCTNAHTPSKKHSQESS